MALIRFMGTLAFILGSTLLALDSAEYLTYGRFQPTSVDRFWTYMGIDSSYALRLHLSEWIGTAADHLVELPAAFVAFGLGFALMLVADNAIADKRERPFAL